MKLGPVLLHLFRTESKDLRGQGQGFVCLPVLGNFHQRFVSSKALHDMAGIDLSIRRNDGVQSIGHFLRFKSDLRCRLSLGIGLMLATSRAAEEQKSEKYSRSEHSKCPPRTDNRNKESFVHCSGSVCR